MTRETDDVFRRVWTTPSPGIHLLSQASHAFAIVAKALRNGSGAPRMWFPDYFCNGALAPLRAAGFDPVFYPLTLDLMPDWDACERLAARAPPNCFVLVHYFGACLEVERARQFCDQHNARLMEDATHLFAAVGGAGTLADFVCHSPRKFFDVPDGGLLLCAGEENERAVQAALAGTASAGPDPTRWRGKRMERRVRRMIRPGRARNKTMKPRRVGDLQPEPEVFGETCMSAFSRRGLARALVAGGIDTVAEKLDAFRDRVARIVAETGAGTLVEPGHQAVVCWVGVRNPDTASAQTAMDALRRRRLAAAAWPERLPPEVATDSNHAIAQQLRVTTLQVNLRGSFFEA